MKVQEVTQEEARTDVTRKRCELRFTIRVFVPRKRVLVTTDWEILSGLAAKTKIFSLLEIAILLSAMLLVVLLAELSGNIIKNMYCISNMHRF
jgi:hypothetical protein